MSHFQTYISRLDKYYGSGKMTEHSYRPYLLTYLEELLPDCHIINEPKRVKVGAPDFILTDSKGIPFAYIETKDIGEKLSDKKHKEQFDRYKSGLDILIITDYLEFHLYKRGVLQQSVNLAKINGKNIVPYTDLLSNNAAQVAQFEYLIQGLPQRDGVNITIKSAEDLAKRMAAKAKLFASIIKNALDVDDTEFEIAEGSLSKQYASFKQILIGDISHTEFADIYAQTIAYGMFAARLHDTTLENFSRREAAELIPKSNPFLRKLFNYVASPDLDERIVWIVDDLAEVFRFTDVAAILKDFGKATQQNDPIIHFYETFLAAYDPALRKARGVWYTPEPVVNFIVRAVDDILKADFGLRDGLADTSKTTVKVKIPTHDKRYKAGMVDYEKEVHRVQLLDPACGTGTFLAETIKHIFKGFKNQLGAWNNYVQEDLIPRLHGFELLMASYAMAHIKLDLLLRDTGFIAKKDSRFKVFLTNALEEFHKDTGTLFAGQWLADEANHANQVKRDAPVMVVLGNPPYAVSSHNKNEWIETLMKDYKKDLNERNIQPLSDDYIKFTRFGQYFVDKNTEGVLAFISNNSFIDGLIHRQMRKSLLESFDKIYIIDLHGSAKRQETAPDGSIDQNVFDIQQGVSINLFIKTGKKKQNALADVFFTEIYGSRNVKYNYLLTNNIKTIKWHNLNVTSPQYFLVKKNFDVQEEFDAGFLLSDLFPISTTGIKTHRDDFVIDMDKKELVSRLSEFANPLKSDDETRLKFFGNKHDGKYLAGDTRDWRMSEARKTIEKFDHLKVIRDIFYRPFDKRKIYYHSAVIELAREKTMYHFLKGDNLGLVIGRQGQAVSSDQWDLVSISKDIVDTNLYYRGGNMVYPLYSYAENSKQTTLSFDNERTPNLNPKLIEQLATAIGKQFIADGKQTAATFSPEDVLDYIYAVLHTPQYRERYKEFLKIDFPRVPYPKNAEQFAAFVKQGNILRGLHLLESDEVDNFITAFPNSGDNILGKPTYDNGRVWLNQAQYFDGVPEIAWTFYIGGYQPAQKWLKDRIGRKLSYDDIRHYQRIIVALTRTAEVMQVLEELFDV